MTIERKQQQGSTYLNAKKLTEMKYVFPLFPHPTKQNKKYCTKITLQSSQTLYEVRLRFVFRISIVVPFFTFDGMRTMSKFNNVHFQDLITVKPNLMTISE